MMIMSPYLHKKQQSKNKTNPLHWILPFSNDTFCAINKQ